jgi:hypothetical protein
VLADFTIASFGVDGAVALGARRVPLPAAESADHDVHCISSFEGWLVGVRLNKGTKFDTLVTAGAS